MNVDTAQKRDFISSFWLWLTARRLFYFSFFSLHFYLLVTCGWLSWTSLAF